MKLVHSFHYFENKVKLENNTIIDTKTNKIIQVLSNFYRDKSIFNVKIERVLNKKKSLQNYKRFFRDKNVNYNICYNTKIVIEVNENNLVKSLKNNNFNDRKNFFALLKRNVDNLNSVTLETNLDDVVNKNQILSESINFNYLGKSVIKIGNLIYDIQLERVYFNEEDIIKNKYNFKIENLSVLFSDNTDYIFKTLNNRDLFNNYNQNLIIFSESKHNLSQIIKDLQIISYVFLDCDNISNITYSEIIGKTIIVSYETLINSYKYNFLINEESYNDTIECLQKFQERYMYETSFMKRDKFLNLKFIILQSLKFDNLIIYDFKLNENRYLDNILLKLIKFKKSYFISQDFLYYKVGSFLAQLENFYDVTLNFESISKTFISNILRQVYIDDYSTLSREKPILFKYSMTEEQIITNSNNLIKSEKRSLPLLFPIKKIQIDDQKFINNNECAICLEKLKSNNTIKTSCNHYFCISCVSKQLSSENSIKCSLCRKQLSVKKDMCQLVNKPKNISGKVGKIFQNINKGTVIVSNYNDNLVLLSKILTNWDNEFNDILLINSKCINNKEFTANKSLLFLENKVEKQTRYLYKNSDVKVLVPVKEST